MTTHSRRDPYPRIVYAGPLVSYAAQVQYIMNTSTILKRRAYLWDSGELAVPGHGLNNPMMFLGAACPRFMHGEKGDEKEGQREGRLYYCPDPASTVSRLCHAVLTFSRSFFPCLCRLACPSYNVSSLVLGRLGHPSKHPLGCRPVRPPRGWSPVRDQPGHGRDTCQEGHQ